MPTPFLSSEEYDERAHLLYNEARYDEAIDVLREGLAIYPNAVELHVGIGYAQLAREEFAWARNAFEQALTLEPEHEDGLAGLGEVLLRLGQDEAALRCFRRTIELGYTDDVDLMLQIGRSLFREGSTRDKNELFESAKEFFAAFLFLRGGGGATTKKKGVFKIGKGFLRYRGRTVAGIGRGDCLRRLR